MLYPPMFFFLNPLTEAVYQRAMRLAFRSTIPILPVRELPDVGTMAVSKRNSMEDTGNDNQIIYIDLMVKIVEI